MVAGSLAGEISRWRQTDGARYGDAVKRWGCWLSGLLLGACSAGPEPCLDEGTAGATATCLAPTQTPEFYVDEALKYFDTLDTSADRARIPRYSERVVRWEWPPWLLLTGYGAEAMTLTADVLRQVDPSTVPDRECRFFDTQPFARCYIVFEYEEGRGNALAALRLADLLPDFDPERRAALVCA